MSMMSKLRWARIIEKYQKQGPLAVQVLEILDLANEKEDPWDLELQRQQASEDVDWCR